MWCFAARVLAFGSRNLTAALALRGSGVVLPSLDCFHALPWRPQLSLGAARGKGQPISGLECRSCCFQVGLVYMFNLIVGTGALTMPKAFATAGWLVSLLLLMFLGFMR